MSGTVGILNVGAGDTKLTFDNSNPMETARACRVVKDMLRRGYALFVEVGTTDDGKPKYARARDFDEKTAEYIIADLDPLAAQAHDQTEQALPSETEQVNGDEPQQAGTKKAAKVRAKAGSKRVPASSTRSVAVARTAGG